METITFQDLTDEQKEAIALAAEKIMNAFRELWEKIVEVLKEFQKQCIEWIKRLRKNEYFMRVMLYAKLRNWHVPHWLSKWIAFYMPKKMIM